MASRSLNKVILIGNLTRDPELRYTPQGNAVCSFGLATNRSWQPQDGGERREETEFHRCVSWNKLAELCSQLLSKGRKVYLEGRLQTRSWDAQDGTKKTVTEVVIEDMIVLDSRREQTVSGELAEEPSQESQGVAKEGEAVVEASPGHRAAKSTTAKTATKTAPKAEGLEDLNIDDIPF